MDWNVDVIELNQWLKKKGIYKTYWTGEISKHTQLRMQFLREVHPERYREIMKNIGKRVSESNRELKQRLVNLLGGKCCKCSFKRYLCSLQFHHKDPRDKWSKDTFSGYLQDPKRFEKDIRDGKILLFCSNCHDYFHSKEGKMHRASFKYKEYHKK